MTKSTITRERAEQLANFKGAPVTRQEEQELARMALAAMDSEPVAWRVSFTQIGHESNNFTKTYWDEEEKDRWVKLHKLSGFKVNVEPLYTSPPAPLAAAYSDFEEFWSTFNHPFAMDDELKEFSLRVWNACRAAMLQDEPVTTANKLGNYLVIQDTWIPVSERIPDDSSNVLCTAEFDGPGDWRKKVGYWYEGGWVVYGASWTPTHWMPLPAAPQEVK